MQLPADSVVLILNLLVMVFFMALLHCWKHPGEIVTEKFDRLAADIMLCTSAIKCHFIQKVLVYWQISKMKLRGM